MMIDIQPPAAVLTAVILMVICSTAEMTGVRLVGGHDHCSGTPEVLYEGQWSRVDSEEIDYINAMVMCRELDCGNTVSVTMRTDFRKEVVISIWCKGNESAVSQCEQSSFEYNTSLTTVITCSDSVRLVDGAGLCSGRVEVKLHQSWTTVCEADFDWQDAEVICRELGCGPPLTLQGALFGEGSRPFGTTEFQCKGTEKSLRTCSTSAREEDTCTRGSAVGLTCSEPDDVRLVDGSSQCAGTVEMFHSGEWRRVSAHEWFLNEADVVCRQLDCGSAVAAPWGKLKENKTTLAAQIRCKTHESALRECRMYLNPPLLFHGRVICSDSVRLVNGTGLCSGRVEVKSDTTWTTVCEADFDWQDAEVVCRELVCGPPLTLQGALFGEGKHPFGTREFQCKGTEKCLLTCRTSTREQDSCIRGSAVGLICSAPRDVRLMDGSSRCAGKVEMFHSGEWRKVRTDGWSIREAVVVCRQLDCGSSVAASWRKCGGDGTGWGVELDCEGTEPAVRKCRFRPYQLSEFCAEVTCSDSVQLVDGAGLCSGRVEVKTYQSWTTVCETDFDWQDAEVACRELGCGIPQTLQAALVGERSHPFGIRTFQCKGTERSLRTCRTSTSEEHTCTHGSAVGLTCSGPSDVKLVDLGSRCAGTVEVFHSGEWRKVNEDYWTITDASVVCRQLDCGSAVAATIRKSKRKRSEWDIGIYCRGSESELRKCISYNNTLYTINAGVICSDVLEKPTISFSTPIRVSRGLERSEVFRGHSFTITCFTQPQFPGGFFYLKLPWTNRSLSQTAVNHSASFLFPAADDSHQGNYSCVYENQLTFQSEILNNRSGMNQENVTGNFSSESESLALTVADSPLPAVITRMLLVPLLLLISCSVIFLIFKKWGHTLVRNPSGQQEGAAAAAAVQYHKNIELVSLQQNVERELPTDLEQEEEEVQARN